MLKKGLFCAVYAASAASVLLFPSFVRSGVLETSIDLSYTYSQTLVAESVSGRTQVQQKYTVKYESGLTSIFDILMKVSLNLSESFDDTSASTSKLAPTVSVEIVGPKARAEATWDSTVATTDAFEEEGKVKTYENNYLLNFEIKPDYWPEATLKLERRRSYEELNTERVGQKLEFGMVKEIGELKLEFDLEYERKRGNLPEEIQENSIGWVATAAYQERVWWDVDVDLAYEVEESFSEEIKKDILTAEDKSYAQIIQVKMKKSLQLTPRLTAAFEYSYEFKQDLLQEEYDYEMATEYGVEVGYKMWNWLSFRADVQRQSEEIYNAPPQDRDENLADSIDLSFKFDPLRWLKFAGKAEWSFSEGMAADSGGSIETQEDATYEVSVNQKWGGWWTLAVTGSSEYEYTEGWLTGKEGKVKADLKLKLFEIINVSPSYTISRGVSYDEYEPLKLTQDRDQEVSLKFAVKKKFTDMISTSFTNEISMQWGEEIDETMSYEKIVELGEDTKFTFALEEILKELTLEGEVARKATDVKDDDEPVLVDITYSLKLDWTINDVTLTSSFQYDDNGATFDVATLNTAVAWQRDNFDVSGEYQFDKTYADELDEARQLNLKMNVKF